MTLFRLLLVLSFTGFSLCSNAYSQDQAFSLRQTAYIETGIGLGIHKSTRLFIPDGNTDGWPTYIGHLNIGAGLKGKRFSGGITFKSTPGQSISPGVRSLYFLNSNIACNLLPKSSIFQLGPRFEFGLVTPYRGDANRALDLKYQNIGFGGQCTIELTKFDLIFGYSKLNWTEKQVRDASLTYTYKSSMHSINFGLLLNYRTFESTDSSVN